MRKVQPKSHICMNWVADIRGINTCSSLFQLSQNLLLFHIAVVLDTNALCTNITECLRRRYSIYKESIQGNCRKASIGMGYTSYSEEYRKVPECSKKYFIGLNSKTCFRCIVVCIYQPVNGFPACIILNHRISFFKSSLIFCHVMFGYLLLNEINNSSNC